MQVGGSGRTARHALVVVQFAVMIGLLVATATLYGQTTFALKEGLKLDTDQVLSVFTPCTEELKQEVLVLAGVTSAACTSSIARGQRSAPARASRGLGSQSVVQAVPVDVGLFELHALQPVAGRFFSRQHGMDVALEQSHAGSDIQPSIVLNEAAVRGLGFASPAGSGGPDRVLDATRHHRIR